MSRSILCILLMLTLAPLVVCASIAGLEPERFEGSPFILKIIVMWIFSLITIPMWPTYIPAIILSPIMMRAVSRTESFKKMKLPTLIAKAMAAGALLGSLVMMPVIVLCVLDRAWGLALNWTLSGAISGATTLNLMVLIYRFRTCHE